MPSGLITGRDVELVTAGVVSLCSAVWFGLLGQSLNWRALVIFVFVAGLSFALAWWDILSRDGRLRVREE